ncbi:pyruvoyl-dependent arginine decarboxylase [Methanorbis rubei]|uniref:Pyruvoyl-dependent arginine decarboxylase n=1 Tax=Methanorbis rubei TaxID=3028300 RepID=A0AAE4MFL4_9EURY|nr:Pyruvoyl-dependent arginine decarboxylase [Methanocorpusculaceae archaeon Cs1]
MAVPEKVFFTKGTGVHKDKLVSFEMALRNAGLAPYNLVTVSSIMPPDADIISREEGLPHLSPGEIVFCVMARDQTNVVGQKVAASVGLAVPQIHDKQHGYLSEYHARDVSSRECGEYAEDLAATMLATIFDIPFDPETAWQEREQIYLASGKIIKTSHVSTSATCTDGAWTTVVVAAVFIMPNHG